MTINTPAPIHKSPDPFGLRARASLQAEMGELRQLVIKLNYRIECMERREQERLHLERMKVLHHTQYFQAMSVPMPTTPAPVEQVQPGDISGVPTHDLPELFTEEVAGEDEDVTYVHQAVRSKASRVTSHHLSQEAPVEDLHTALAEHMRACQKPTDVIVSNAVAGCLLDTPLKYLSGVKWRYNGLLPDNEFLCVSNEDGGSHGISSTAPQLG